MSNIVTHLGKNLNWVAYKNGHNQYTITFTSSGSAFDISTYTFVVNIRSIGGTTNKLQLTEGSGITNGGATGIVTIDLTKTQASTTLPRDLYFYEIVYTKSSKEYPLIQGTLTLSSETNPSSTTTSVSVSVSLAGTALSAAVTLNNTVTSSEIITALGYTPYNASTNASKFIRGNSGTLLRTSDYGAVDDADLSLGSTTFGTDNYTVLQALLDEAANGPITIIWDGKYSTSATLKVRGNTYIMAMPGCGVILRDHSDCVLMTNYNPAKPSDITSVAFDNIVDKNIRIDNLILNGNGYNTGATGSDVFDTANNGSAVNGSAQTKRNQILDFTGVENFTLNNIQLLQGRYWSAAFSNVRYGHMVNVYSNHGTSSTRDDFNYDGLHFKGMVEDITIDNPKIINAKDDNIALNAHAQLSIYTDYIGFIRNIVVNNLFLDSRAMGIGIYSETSSSRIDNIVFNGVKGRTHSIFARITAGESATPSGLGDIGSLTFRDIEVEVGTSSTLQQRGGLFSIAANVEKLTFKDIRRVNFGAVFPFFSIYNHRAGTITIKQIEIDGVKQNTTGGTWSKPFVWVNKSQGSMTGVVAISRLLVSNYMHLEDTSFITSDVVRIEGASNLVTGLMLSNIDAVRINTLVNNVSGTLSAVQAIGVTHNGSAAASFISASTVARILLSNIQSSILTSGTFTVKKGDGFVVEPIAKASLPSAAQFQFCNLVTDEAGGAVAAFSDGTNWRRVTDRAIVS